MLVSTNNLNLLALFSGFAVSISDRAWVYIIRVFPPFLFFHVSYMLGKVFKTEHVCGKRKYEWKGRKHEGDEKEKRGEGKKKREPVEEKRFAGKGKRILLRIPSQSFEDYTSLISELLTKTK